MIAFVVPNKIAITPSFVLPSLMSSHPATKKQQTTNTYSQNFIVLLLVVVGFGFVARQKLKPKPCYTLPVLQHLAEVSADDRKDCHSP